MNFSSEEVSDTFQNMEIENLIQTVKPYVNHELVKVSFIVIISFLFFKGARYLFLNIARRFAQKTKSRIDDLFIEHKVIQAIALYVPVVILRIGAKFLPKTGIWIEKIAFVILSLAVALTMDRLISVGLTLYEEHPISRRWPLKGYAQIVKLIVYIGAVVVAFCVILDKSPWGIISGLGAMSAILMLVFRHTILSFVASFQVITQDLIRIGDWIEMPKYNVDGEVVDITLTNLIVRNWDKTLVVVPTYKLLEDSYKNWRGMQESGARRIKRAIYIDQHSVKICDEKMIERLKRIHLIKDYIETKLKEIEEYNISQGIDTEASILNGRRLTNLGTFRIYIEEYLKQHPKIRKDMTLMVRHLQPTPQGLPLEVYAFVSDTRWVHYEKIQADIFDHILAAIQEFDLRVFQFPSGFDLRKAIKEDLKLN